MYSLNDDDLACLSFSTVQSRAKNQPSLDDNNVKGVRKAIDFYMFLYFTDYLFCFFFCLVFGKNVEDISAKNRLLTFYLRKTRDLILDRLSKVFMEGCLQKIHFIIQVISFFHTNEIAKDLFY